MPAEIRVPSMGESIAEATVGTWLKKEGDRVAAGEPVVELETEKANVEISAEAGGVLERITKKTGDTVKAGDVVGVIGGGAGGRGREAREEARERAREEPGERGERAPERAEPRRERAEAPERAERAPARGAPARKAEAEAEAEPEAGREEAQPREREAAPAEEVEATPVARRLADERGVDLATVKGTGRGGKVTREDVEAFAEREERPAEAPEEEEAERAEAKAAEPEAAPAERAPAAERPRKGERAEPEPRPVPAKPAAERTEERIRQTRRRQTIARRLVEAHQTAVMTTTFNELDMTNVMELRKRRRESFKERFGVDLGIMSFFVRAVVVALRAYPRLNSSLDGEDVVLKRYYDIGIAVASDEGLVVPVLRDAERRSFAEIEKAIAGMVQRTRERKLTLEELQGGTFTITNGGVFGSLMSTPILNPPQVGILGMHRAFDRPVAVDGKVEVRPMMYVALTYDHRVVDGADAVRFLIHVKGLIEDPGRLLVEG